MSDGTDADRGVALDQRRFLQERRARQQQAPARPPRLVWVVVGLLHLLFVLGLRLAMTPPPPLEPMQRGGDQVMEVRFLPPDAVDPIPSPPPPQSAPLPFPATRVADALREVPSVVVEVERVPAPGPAPAGDPVAQAEPRLKLFNPDGSMHLSQETVKAAEPAAPLYRTREVVMPHFMRRRSPIAYAPTRFESSWVPRDETMVGEFFRKAVVEKTFKTPWGTRISCTWIIVLGGCSFGSAPTALANAPPRPGMSNPVPAAPPPGPPETIAPYDPPHYEKGLD